MIRLLFLVACLFVTGCASTNSGLRHNGVVSVTGVGRTFEEAKDDGLTRAVEIVVGQVLLTETQVKNNNLVKDEIIKHSAGYVDDFTVTNKVIAPNKVTLSMEVKVRDSKIAERVLNVASTNGKVSGEKLSTQYQTYMKNRASGDALIRKVLTDYPTYAYNVKSEPAIFKLDKERNAYIIVPYEIRWNYKYLKALNEALALVQDGKSSEARQERIAVQSKDPSSWILGATDFYYFNDSYRFRNIQQRFSGTITVVATVSDDAGNVIFSGCDEAFQTGDGIINNFTIYGNDFNRGAVGIQIDKDSPKMKLLNKANNVKVTYGSGRCYNYIQ